MTNIIEKFNLSQVDKIKSSQLNKKEISFICADIKKIKNDFYFKFSRDISKPINSTLKYLQV